MKSVFDLTTANALDEYLRAVACFRSFNLEEARALALSTMKYYKGNADERLALRAMQALEDRWYVSLKAGIPDYGVYDNNYYVSDIWACWVVYSRKSLKTLMPFLSFFHGVTSIADLGCGIGYTTAGLKELFPSAAVYGTQLEKTFQYEVAKGLGRERGFAVFPVVQPKTEFIFASEYFEHFEAPTAHLREVLAVAGPRYLVLVNSFGSLSIGHFSTYQHEGRSVPNYQMGRTFNDVLRRSGYKKVETGFWNNRPAVWERA